ncbi:MAG TPA: hypothetical protein VIG91_02545, partial [Terriglobales bacterium]
MIGSNFFLILPGVGNFDSVASRWPQRRSASRTPLRGIARSCYVQFLSGNCMIRSYKGMKPTIPSTCFVDESAQIIG